MKTIDRRSTAFALALFALAGSMIAVAPATAQAAHPQKKSVVESRSFRDFVRRLDRAGHDQRVLDQRFFRDLERAGRRSREWQVFGQYLLGGRLDWYRAETSRYWVRANYPDHYSKYAAVQAPRVFVSLRGAPGLAEAVRYELMQSYRGRDVVFVGRRGRADLVVEIDGLISDPLFSPAGRSLKMVKFSKRKRRALSNSPFVYARFDRVREKVRIKYDLRLTLRSGGRVIDRERARGYVSDIFASAQNYRVVTAAGRIAVKAFPSRRIEALYRAATGGRLDVIAGLEDRLVRALAHEVKDLRFPSRYQLARANRHEGRFAKGPDRGRDWRSSH